MSSKRRLFHASDLSSKDRVAVFMYKYSNEKDQVVATKYNLTVNIVKNIYTGVTPLRAEEFDFEGCPITFEKYSTDVEINRKELRPIVHKSHVPHKDAPSAALIISMLRDKGAGLSAKETYMKYVAEGITPAKVKSAWAGRYKLKPGTIGEGGLISQDEYDMLVGLKRDTKFKASSVSEPGPANSDENACEDKDEDENVTTEPEVVS